MEVVEVEDSTSSDDVEASARASDDVDVEAPAVAEKLDASSSSPRLASKDTAAPADSPKIFGKGDSDGSPSDEAGLKAARAEALESTDTVGVSGLFAGMKL